MHPARSLVLFTTLSGIGLGLAFWTGIGALGNSLPAVAVAAFLAALFGGGGLLASVFHLRRPTRAVYALSQWRSSWLSREGILAPVALGLAAIHAIWFWWAGVPFPVLGWLAAIASGCAVFATAMIYSQLRAVPAWYSWLTPAVFLCFAAAGGALLAATVAAGAGEDPQDLLLVAMPLQVVAWAAKIRYWRRAARIGTGPSSMASATGLGARGRVRLLEPPHTGSNYLLTEMGYVVARRHAGRLRVFALAFGASAIAVTAVWALGGQPEPLAAPLLGASCVLHLAGVAIARWLFYAEATHTVTLYYGRDPATAS